MSGRHREGISVNGLKLYGWSAWAGCSLKDCKQGCEPSKDVWCQDDWNE